MGTFACLYQDCSIPVDLYKQYWGWYIWVSVFFSLDKMLLPSLIWMQRKGNWNEVTKSFIELINNTKHSKSIMKNYSDFNLRILTLKSEQKKNYSSSVHYWLAHWEKSGCACACACAHVKVHKKNICTGAYHHDVMLLVICIGEFIIVGGISSGIFSIFEVSRDFDVRKSRIFMFTTEDFV